MSLLAIPEEVLALICNLLDTQSVYNLYETCIHLRGIVSIHGVIKSCDMSRSKLATANSLKHPFFVNISGHLRELNLCSIQDLSKTAVLNAMKRMKSLVLLDVSFTPITIPDLIDLYQVCPTLKSVSINFLFGKYPRDKIPLSVLLQCQKMFYNFENVTFVGSISNLIYSYLPLYTLQNSPFLNVVKFVAIKCQHMVYQTELCDSVPKFNQLLIFLLNWKQLNEYYGTIGDGQIFSNINMEKNEYVLIKRLKNFSGCDVYVSQALKGFFSHNFNVAEIVVTKLDEIKLNSNVVFMMWNKETTRFDSTFFGKLFNQVKKFFPVDSSTNQICSPIGTHYCWGYVTLNDDAYSNSSKINEQYFEPMAKRNRTALLNYSLDLDEIFKVPNTTMLTIEFQYLKSSVTLNAEASFLKKISFLCLNGNIRYCSDFFNKLFSCCESLVTLDMETGYFCPCASLISRSITLSTSLRNFRLVEKRIDLKMLLLAFSQCRQIENIHIQEQSTEPSKIGDVSVLIERCPSLYNIFIKAPMSDAARKAALRCFNNAKSKNKRSYLNIELYSDNSFSGLSYDPLIDVFNLNPIKPI